MGHQDGVVDEGLDRFAHDVRRWVVRVGIELFGKQFLLQLPVGDKELLSLRQTLYIFFQNGQGR